MFLQWPLCRIPFAHIQGKINLLWPAPAAQIEAKHNTNEMQLLASSLARFVENVYANCSLPQVGAIRIRIVTTNLNEERKTVFNIYLSWFSKLETLHGDRKNQANELVTKPYTVYLFLLKGDDCRHIIFKEPVANRAMKDHVIRSEEVLNEGTCRVLCYMEPNCVSINLGPLIGGRQKCELNNLSDENQFITFLEDEPSFIFLAIEVT